MNKIDFYLAQFNKFWEIDREIPSGTIERSKATHIEGGTWQSKGQEMPRLCLDGLKDEKYKIAAKISSSSRFEPVQVRVGKVVRNVFVNVRSVLKRLSPREDVRQYEDGTLSFDEGFHDYFKIVVRRTQEKELLKDRDELRSIPELVRIAKEQNRSFRLTPDFFPVEHSMDIHPDFVAVDTDEPYGMRVQQGVRETISITPDGMKVVRRAESFLKQDREAILQKMKIYNDLMGVGVITPLSMGFHLPSTESESYTFVLYHVKDHGEFSDIHDFLPTEKDLLDVTHQLLQGLARIAQFGGMGNLTPDAIRIRKHLRSMTAEIYDLSQFQYGREREKDVLDMGKLLNHLFLSYTMINQVEFPSLIETLVEGMQIFDRKRRWTAEQCLKFFEENLALATPTEEEKKKEE